MASTPVTTGSGRDNPYALRRLVSISLLTLALYVATWLLERAISRNGAAASAPMLGPPYPADRGLLAWQMTCYVAVTLLVFWAYLAVLRMCQGGELQGQRARLLALAVPVLLNLVCLLWLPRFSQDVLSYAAHGFLGLIPGHNPLLRPVQEARNTAIGPVLAALGWDTTPGITPYGILWTRLEMAVMSYSGGNVLAAALCFKATAMITSLGAAAMIWLILGRTSPALQLQGTLAYLWNPLIIMEFAGEGHNDALMIFLSTAAIAAAIAYKPAISIIAQFLGAMSKYTCVLFLPAQLCFLWRYRRTAGSLTLQFIAALVVTAAIALLLYAPLWAGLHSFDGVVSRAEPARRSATLFGVINWLLLRSPLESVAGPATSIIVALPALAWITWSTVRVRDAADLVRSCAWISLAYVLLASPDFWPWYACVPVAWIAVGDPSRLFWLALLMSLMARLVAPLDLLRDHGYLIPQVSKGMTTGLGTLVPLIALAVWAARRWQQHRRSQRLDHRGR